MARVNKTAKNLAVSVFAQVVSIVTSFVLGFIVPKFVDEYQYAYWQTFVLYIGYSALLHFGVFDGLILRYSQYDYEELDKARFRSQFQLVFFLNLIFCAIGSVIAISFISGVYKYLVIFICVGFFARNIYTYNMYVFRLTNRINNYATIVIAQRAVYALAVVVLLLLKVNDFVWLCIAEIFGDFVASLIGAVGNKGLLFGKTLTPKETFKEARANIEGGSLVMLAAIFLGLLVGGTRMVVQWRWGDLVFGKLSFGFSIYSICLMFITAIRVVIFPILKRMKEEELPKVYFQIRKVISPLFIIAIIAYFPLCAILRLWLPKYNEGLLYLGMILPVIVFTSKLTIITNNYMKVFRKEKELFAISVASVVACFGLGLFCAYVLNSIELVVLSLVVVCIVRSLVSEIIVMRIIKQKGFVDFIVEIIMTAIFIIAIFYFSLWWACLIYAVALLIYMIIFRKDVKSIITFAKSAIEKGDKKPVDSSKKEVSSVIGDKDSFYTLYINILKSELCEETLSDDVKENINAETVKRLYKISKSHDVAHIVGNALIKNNLITIDHPCYNLFVTDQAMAIARYENINYEYNRLCEFFEEEGIDFLPLKGSVLRPYYPTPEMRTSCDIDILIKLEDLDRAVIGLTEKLSYRKDKVYNHDVSLYSVGNVHLELHFKLKDEEDEIYSEANEYFNNIWQNTQANGDFIHFKKMKDETFAVYNIFHTAKHFILGGGCGVRAFMDLWIIRHKIGYNEEKFSKLLSDCGLKKFGEAALKLAEIWFGEDSADEFYLYMQRYILRGEIYGGKINQVVMDSTKKKSKFKYVLNRLFLPYNVMVLYYPSLKRCPVLYPFYQIVRWFKALFGKGRRKAVKEINAYGNVSEEERQAMLILKDRLDI